MPLLWYLWWVVSNGVIVYASAAFFCTVAGTDPRRHMPALVAIAAVLTVAVIRFQLPGAFWLELPLWMLYEMAFLKIRWTALLAPLVILCTLRTLMEGVTAVLTAWAAIHLKLSNYGPLVQIALSLVLHAVFFLLLWWLQRRAAGVLRNPIAAGCPRLLLSGALMVLAVRYGLRLDSPAFAQYLSAFRLGASATAILLLTGAAVVFFIVTEQETTAVRLTRRLAGQRKYLEEAEKRNAHCMAFQHDLNNHLLVLSGLLREAHYQAAEQYMEKLQAGCHALTARNCTGNLVLDMLFQEKLSHAQRCGISVDCRVRIPQEFSIEDMDLCIIFSNILDNAIAACMGVEPSERVLRIKTTVRAGLLVIESTNPVATSRPVQKGTGLRNIERTAARYQGCTELETADGMFRISVLLCSGQTAD